MLTLTSGGLLIALAFAVVGCATAPSAEPAVSEPPRDGDQDNIDDREDQCPDERETYNGSGDEDGCPDRSHSLGVPTRLSGGRRVDGPDRPVDCPIFRRLLSPAGNLERWFLEFPPDMASHEFFLDEVRRIVEVVAALPTSVELIGELGVDDRGGEALQQRRIEFVRDLLIARGAPADRLRVGIAPRVPVPRGRVGFRIADRSLITVDLSCFPRLEAARAVQ